MQNFRMTSDWLRVALLLSEISPSIGSFGEQGALRHECLFTIIMSLKRKRSVLSIKDKQAIILRLEKEEKGTNLSAEYGVSKRQISDIRKSKEKDHNVCQHVYRYSQRTVKM